MPIIHHTVEIKASPEAVFDLISKVENFCQFSSTIETIKPIDGDAYHWVVRIGGMVLEWDTVVTACSRPQYFAWRSISGVSNEGSYTLTPTSSGTLVTLSMKYRLANPLAEKVIKLVTTRLIQRIASEVLMNVKNQIENNTSPPPLHLNHHE